MYEYYRQFIKDKYNEGLTVKEIAAQVPLSIRDVISTVAWIETIMPVGKV